MESKKNSMGSEVVKGFRCKPTDRDKNKPIMFSAVHLFICEGERCRGRGDKIELAAKLREIAKSMHFDRGEDRIKVTRTFCNGACRFGQFAYAYKNVKSKNFSQDNAFTAWKNVHSWTESQWVELIMFLVKNEPYSTIGDFKVEQQIFLGAGI